MMLKRKMSRLALRVLSSSPLPLSLSLRPVLRPGASLTVTSLIPTPCPWSWTAVTVRGVGWLATGFGQGKTGRKLAGPSTATAGVTFRPTFGRTSQGQVNRYGRRHAVLKRYHVISAPSHLRPSRSTRPVMPTTCRS